MKTLIQIFSALTLSSCTVGTFSFAPSEASNPVGQCTTGIRVSDANGVRVQDQVFIRGKKLVLELDGTPPYEASTNYGTVEGNGNTYTYTPSNLPSNQETSVTISFQDSNKYCETVTFRIRASGIVDESFGTSGTQTLAFSSTEDDEISAVQYDSTYDRILGLGLDKASSNWNTVFSLTDDSGSEILNQSFDFSNYVVPNNERLQQILIDPNDTDRYYLGGSVQRAAGFFSIISRIECTNCSSTVPTAIAQDGSFIPYEPTDPISALEGGFGGIVVYDNIVFAMEWNGDFGSALSTLYSLDSSGGYLTHFGLTNLVMSALDLDSGNRPFTAGRANGLVLRSRAYTYDEGPPPNLAAQSILSGALSSFGMDTDLQSRAVKRLPSGRMVVVGDYADRMFVGLFEDPTADPLVRGRLLSYFAGGPTASTDLSNDIETAMDIELDEDSGIYVVGTFKNTSSLKRGYVAKFIVQGDQISLDTSFGVGGNQLDYAGNSLNNTGFHYLDLGGIQTVLNSITRDNEGRLVVGGTIQNTTWDAVIHRFYP